ncbi:hypothetical protein D3H55_01985 [Bacillus salacetis]|uniref:FAD/NAD(P)-binding domain-containing protein n=2 Tax=Bacillus salacetis TaxID=2315464 RepID=A0A3A1R979_9BACI|nr:hypothetical protein D3H55_01985 [Bacillus salacetis]
MKRLEREPMDDVEITLVSPSKYQYYPELFSGYIEDRYTKEEIRVDLERAAKEAGVIWKKGAILSIDPVQKLALTAGGEILDFDLLSIDIGSMTSGTDKTPLTEDIYTIKPNYQFTASIDAIRLADNLVITGANRAAVEIGSSLQSWRMQNGLHNSLTLISPNKLLSDKMTPNASAKIVQLLTEKGIELHLGSEIQAIRENKILLPQQEIHFDKMLWAQDPKAPDLFKLSKLPVDHNGFLLIENTLQVKKYPFIFGTGECAVMEGMRPYSHSFYTSIKQGNVLYTNIKGFLGTGEGELYTGHIPKLSPLELGRYHGLAVFNNRTFHGKIPWLLRQLENKRLLKN